MGVSVRALPERTDIWVCKGKEKTLLKFGWHHPTHWELSDG